MTIQVELTPEAEARLSAKAREKGISLQEAAEQVLQDALAAGAPAVPAGRLTVEEFHAMLREMAEGAESRPRLPDEAFTRESFYERNGG